MSGIGSIDGFSPLSFLKSSSANRYAPEPKSSHGSSSWVDYVKGMIKLAGKGASLGGIDPQYSDLLIRQIEMQEQMMLVSMSSNIEKSRHETRMASVRNMRVA